MTWGTDDAADWKAAAERAGQVHDFLLSVLSTRLRSPLCRVWGL